MSFTWRSRIRSFGYAFEGITMMLKTQHNAWLHLLASGLVGLAAVILEVSAADWRWLVVAMLAMVHGRVVGGVHHGRVFTARQAGHRDRHGVADPAANGQQGDQQGDEEHTHGGE